jgi:single-strand DNA-binding protein
MSGVNQITIVGRVGADPDLRFSENNTPYCRFSVAVNEQWTKDGERKERVTWFPVIAFNGLSEVIANHVGKGRLLAVQGRVQTREYEDKAGTQHQVMQLIAEKVTFLGSAKREENEEPRPAPGRPCANNAGEDGPPF